MSSEDIRDDDGQVTTTPGDFPVAVELVRERGLSGLWIRPDFLDKRPDAPQVDLTVLASLPSLRSFGVAEGVAPRRLRGFAAIEGLTKLRKLTIYDYEALDLSQLGTIEILMIRERPKLVGLERLQQLRELWITSPKSADFSRLAAAKQLTRLHVIRASFEALTGLDKLTALTELQLSHCAKLRSISPLPTTLEELKIMKCGKLTQFDFLADMPALETLYVENIDSLAFVAKLPRLRNLGFARLGDGQLGPVLNSSSLRQINFHPPRKHYSHTLAQLREALAVRGVGG